MLGDTFPEKAVPGSIRGHLHKHPHHFGFESVTIANNTAHLSAGPYEAVFELQNFLRGVPSLNFDIRMTRQARHFIDSSMSVDDLTNAITNPSASIASAAPNSLFDTTEECDGSSATYVYRTFFK